MVLQCGASVAALPEHEEMIFTASVEVSGVGLVGSRPLCVAVAYSRGCCGLLSGGTIPHPCDYAPKYSRFCLGVTLPLSYPIPTRQNKAREALFHSSRVNLSF